MKILVTGSGGFIGKNLISHLKEKENIEIITFDKEDSFEKIENNIEDIDFIFHLAGINRPKEVSEFYKGNTDLTAQIIKLLEEKKLQIPLAITSSIQATRDNDYGKSKKQAEDIVLEHGKKGPIFVYRLHNVFGKWCRPNYNSVVATFCYNVANDKEILINDPNAELELIYIDDIVKEFCTIISTNKPSYKIEEYCYINPKYNIKLGELANLIKGFKERETLYVPNTGNEFVKKLYSTYVSYIPLENMVTDLKQNVDCRGSFVELIKTEECGQFAVSFSKPGVIRGNHYHHTKMERFIVLKGTAKIRFKSIVNESSYEIIATGDNIKSVTIPVGYTHSIENIGNDEMILAIWGNEVFNKDIPDTFYMEAK